MTQAQCWYCEDPLPCNCACDTNDQRKQVQLVLRDSAKRKLATMTTEERKGLIDKILRWIQRRGNQ